MASLRKVSAVLIDLSGTLHIEDKVVGNAVEALEKLRSTKIPLKFVTNTTKESVETLHNRLTHLGFRLDKQEIHSSLTAASAYIRQHNLNPFYIVSDDALREFPAADPNNVLNAVVVGLAPEKFRFEVFNQALDVLRKGGQLVAIHQGRYYKTSEGMAVGPGFVVKGLEFSAGCKATVIGKPDAYFFLSGRPRQDIDPAECLMIGDDPIDDIKGAKAVGFQTVLVKTGKYGGAAEKPLEVDTIVADDFSAAVEMILKGN